MATNKKSHTSAPPSASSKGTTGEETSYHHGNLREALIDATLQLIQEEGVAAVSVREVAKRLGVSPGAPFRHFANKKALLTAVAEQGMADFAASIRSEMQAAKSGGELRAMGLGYLRWALRNRAQFAVISNRDELDFAQSESLLQQSETIMQHLNALIIDFMGEKTPREMMHARLVFRGFVYGVARMAIDRHLEEWNIPEKDQLKTAEAVLDSFLSMLGRKDV